jgi:hypothetical protein
MRRLREFYYFFRYDIPYGLKNLWDYFPLIWNDRDYDHSWLSRLMAFKLRRMQRGMKKYSYHLTAEHDARNIQICAYIMERLAEDWMLDLEVMPNGKYRDRTKDFLELFGKIFTKQLRRWWW